MVRLRDDVAPADITLSGDVVLDVGDGHKVVGTPEQFCALWLAAEHAAPLSRRAREFAAFVRAAGSDIVPDR